MFNESPKIYPLEGKEIEDLELDDLIFAKDICIFSGKEYSTANFKNEDYLKFKNGIHIQNAIPYLSVDDREFLLNKISPEGWNLMYE